MKFTKWSQLAYCKELEGNDIKALMIILSYHNAKLNGYNWNNTPNKELEKGLGIHRINIIKLVNRLVSMNLITKAKSGYGNANDLQPNIEAINAMIERNVSPTLHSNVAQTLHSNVAQTIHNTNSNNTNKKEKVIEKEMKNNYLNSSLHTTDSNSGEGAYNSDFCFDSNERVEVNEGERDIERIDSKETTAIVHPTGENVPPAQHQSNLDYIDRLERIYNATPIQSEVKYTYLSSETIDALNVCELSKDTIQSIVRTLTEASKNPHTFIAAAKKLTEFISYRPHVVLWFYEVIYNNAVGLLQSNLSENAHKYALDTLKLLRGAIVRAQGKDSLQPLPRAKRTIDTIVCPDSGEVRDDFELGGRKWHIAK